MKTKHKERLMKIMAIVMIAVMILPLFPQQEAEAHDMSVIQTTIDPNNYTYNAMVKVDKTILFDKDGLKGIEATHDAFEHNFEAKFKNGFPSVGGTGEDYDEIKEYDGVKVLPNFSMGFPSVRHENFFNVAQNNMTKADSDRADLIAKRLTRDLNAAVDLIGNGERPETMEDHVARVASLTKAVQKAADNPGKSYKTINGYQVKLGKKEPYPNQHRYDVNTGLRDIDWVTISDGSRSSEFVFRYLKGYKSGGKWDNSELKRGFDYSGDVSTITWNMIIYQAHYFYYAQGVGSSNAGDLGSVSGFEKDMVEMLQSVLDGFNGMLGLYSSADLIYNSDLRGSTSWHYGVFPDSWQTNMDKFYWVSMGLAFSLLSLSLFKLVIMRNLSIMNPNLRVSLMEGMQDIIITTIILAFILPLINFLLMINFRIVDVFANFNLPLDEMSSFNNFNTFLSGVLMQFYYFFIQIWLNFTYIIRSIVIAILIILAPMFVVSIAFGGKWKGLFGLFLKELVGNIFLQSFHAFAITFIFMTTAMTTGMERAVAFFALIILTEFFRNLVFGNAGGIAGQVGLGAVATGAGLAGGALAAARNSKNKNKNEDNSKSDSNSNSNEGGSSSGESSNSTESSSSGGGSVQPVKTGNSDTLRNAGQSMDTSTVREEPSIQSMERGIEGENSNTESSGPGRMENFKNQAVSAGKGVGSALANGTRTSAQMAGSPLGKAGAALGTAGMVGAAYAMAFGGTDGGQSARMASRAIGGHPNHQNGGGRGGNGGQNGQSFNSNSSEKEGTAINGVEASSVNGRDDGMTDLEYRQEEMAERGVYSANDIGGGRTEVIYDESKLPQEDQENLSQIRNTMLTGTQDQKDELRSQGIVGVGTTTNGMTSVQYDEQGRQNLGFEKARTHSGKIQFAVNSNQGHAPQMTIPQNHPNGSGPPPTPPMNRAALQQMRNNHGGPRTVATAHGNVTSTAGAGRLASARMVQNSNPNGMPMRTISSASLSQSSRDQGSPEVYGPVESPGSNGPASSTPVNTGQTAAAPSQSQAQSASTSRSSSAANQADSSASAEPYASGETSASHSTGQSSNAAGTPLRSMNSNGLSDTQEPTGLDTGVYTPAPGNETAPISESPAVEQATPAKEPETFTYQSEPQVTDSETVRTEPSLETGNSGEYKNEN